SFPYLLYQCWMFIAPGLLSKERVVARRVILWSTGLFIGGALFGFFIVLPKTLSFFMSYAGENLEPMPKLGLYLTFVARMVLAFFLLASNVSWVALLLCVCDGVMLLVLAVQIILYAELFK
ncbi:MAG: preprotein translocase subunit TatC, partial [Candidatus Electrothrix sp. AX5]|nr:preprotein translocase subunit TatC [Candidatus Electrothrix sp. AX5]